MRLSEDDTFKVARAIADGLMLIHRGQNTILAAIGIILPPDVLPAPVVDNRGGGGEAPGSTPPVDVGRD